MTARVQKNRLRLGRSKTKGSTEGIGGQDSRAIRQTRRANGNELATDDTKRRPLAQPVRERLSHPSTDSASLTDHDGQQQGDDARAHANDAKTVYAGVTHETAIGWLAYGNCPVQIDRVIGDRRFYFRARGEHWSLCVGEAGDMGEFAAVNGTEILSGYIDVPMIAGWMPHELANALADWGIDCWTRQQSGEFERNKKEFMDALVGVRVTP